ncbi:MAG: Asp-tRNA(Asn)/Glu-tRNA(Gln) amidotransferase GatCAB subunit A [Dehalococcoidia bacterium]|nr:Asp-tRNA(Asn)/Glu-tRNA(Gln) amidotransferase GatCAB subunit A [Dehalococcoidia bacterium]|tara:strand:- start:1446 stop:2897 length:1452 start_codon:yes stop_codon:yes gene_type:complete
MIEPSKLTVTECINLIQDKEVSVTEITELFLERSKEINLKINSLITVCEDSAIKQAKEIDSNFEEYRNKPLLGVPISVKDVISTKNIKTTAGSKILNNYIPPYNAFVVDKLKDAGAIIISKSNCDEFAMGSSNETSFFGPCLNPWDLNTVPGGSSGGSAASVASSQSLISIGSDTGGSIRQPASLCGIVGMKPTYGSVSRAGLIAFGSSLDQIGPFAKNVHDCEKLFYSIAGHDPKDLTSSKKELKNHNDLSSLKGIRIGICNDISDQGISEGVKKAFNNSVDTMRSLGADIGEISIDYIKESLPVYYLTAPSEASSNLNRYDGIKYGFSDQNGKTSWETIGLTRSNFGEEVKRRILLGTFALSSGYYDEYYGKAQKIRGLIINSFNEAFKKFDLIISPTSPITAFEVGSQINDPLLMYQNDICTMPANIAGIPAISIPCGFSNELPVGLQIMGPNFSESKIFSVAKLIENSMNLNILEGVKV